MADASAITALLGPTNTGKTHRAIERMLEHASGMIGLPLRLLAREVYDKVSAKVGESAVALVTGEEQRIPPRPSYWVCTVEAMPVERDVDFVAIDEVQLAASEQRGHVFTSRLLHARGRSETWFLGADTMRGAIAELVPTAKIAMHPRLSSLRFAGEAPLARLPPRTAVVAFSMTHVYELAERLRARKGGAAVVLGALSPRTRNAQVAMFQAGEVDYLVATDAIGMGLNLDCAHVAFAALRKFDGHDVRVLEDAELAQIAGRAGRWIADGTFGAIEPLEIPLSTARAIEEHRFDPVRRLRWRNDRLDFGSIEALEASLDQRPTRGILRGVHDAEDRAVLARLAKDDAIRAAARGEDNVRLLWDVCTIPDFRKLLFEAHAELLGELFLELAHRGRLSDEWLRGRMRGLDDTSGDVETLVARIAATRTWTYVSNRASWLESPAAWQEETRALEDRLSDALHARLVLRFVDAKKGPAPKRARPRTTAPKAQAPDAPLAIDASHPFAALAGLRARLAEPARGEPVAGPSWVDAVIDAGDDAFALDAQGRIVHAATKRPLGAIVRGASIALPDVRLAGEGDLGAGARSRLQRRLLAYARDVVNALLGDLRPLASREATAFVRGLVHRVEQGLGTVRAADVADLTRELDERDRAALAEAGLTLGRVVVYVAAGLRPRAVAERAALASIWFGAKRPIAPPRGGAVSFVARSADASACTAIGYPLFGPRAVRADVAERAASRLDDPQLASLLGCTTREARAIAEALR